MYSQNQLQFNIAQLLKEGVGATRSYELDIELKTIFHKDINAVSHLTGRIEFLYSMPTVLVTGSLKIITEKNCDRCLTTFITPLKIGLEEQFFPMLDINTGHILQTPPEIDKNNLINKQHLLDLTDVIRQEIVVNSDTVFYCQPECKGLCPHCGQDLNIKNCGCRENLIDPRWSGLLTKQE